DSTLVKWASQSEPWSNSVEVVENKVHTYRFEIQSNRDRPGGPGGAGMRGGPAAPGGIPGGGPRGGPPAGIGPPPPTPPPGLGGPPGTGQGGSGDLRHFLLAFRECQSAKFSIES